jgi:hypothetical protein
MFYQNSNDLVKQASVNSGHVQNSYATQKQLNQGKNIDANNGAGVLANDERGGPAGSAGFASLNLGAQFQNALNSIIGSFTSSGSSAVIEGLNDDTSAAGPPAGGAPSVATPGTGPVGGNADQTQVLNGIVKQDADYVAQEETQRNRVKAVRNISAADNNNSRGKWTQVIDSNGISKYGYLTKDRIFQIWLAPTDPKNNPQNWFETSPVKQNGGVLGCPVTGGNLTKFEIDVKWDEIKPFDMVYAKNDTSHKTPLFMLTNDGVRDAKRTPGSSGLFSCGNERTNVFVKERPSADFDTSIKTNRQGCYIVNDNVKDSVFNDRGFVFQEDMANASISQCKRRAEDLGSSYFLVSAPEPGGPDNRGGCWIYTGSGEPNLTGLLSYDESGKKCYNHGQSDGNEDGFMKSYGTTILPRLYGKSNTIDVSSEPPNPTCDHRTKDGCIFKDYIHYGNGLCYPPNRNGHWAYGGIYNFSNNELKGWLGEIERRNADGMERPAVQEYIERCKNTKGYEFLDDNQVKLTKQQNSVALYSLKVGGPTGVDATDRNGRGVVGRIAYIDHNGDRHDYPESALSYMNSGGAGGADASGAMRYVNVGPYDTRSAESSYSLKEITPGAYSEAANLLYKASRDGWGAAAFHQRCDNKGPTYTRAIINDGKVLGAYTSLSWSSTVQNYAADPTAFLYDGTKKFTPNNSAWGTNPPYSTYMNSSYMPTFGGGHDFYISGQSFYNNAYTFLSDGDRGAPFGRKYASYQGYTLSDLEVYAVDSTSFPKTLDYIRRVRTMPVGESITASMEKCQAMCDGDDKCGGFVYSKGGGGGGGGGDGKCELKDKTKMYPVGLRVVDHNKRLMLKVPAINGTISDAECAASGNGKYNMIDSAQYQYYPDGGAMSSSTKCNLATMVPKEGTLTMPDVAPAVNAVNQQTNTTTTKITEYKNQMDTFTTLREGLDIETSARAGGSTYGATMAGVSSTLKQIGNAQYQRERLDAIKDESNKMLIAESYKFILWSILAILAVMALLKIKEMFGQDDADEDAGGDDGAIGGGGILGFITSLFGMKAVNLNDIADRTGDVKAAIADAGTALQQSGANLATGITEGADNLVNSVNDAAANAVDGARKMAEQVSETAANAVSSIGETASASVSASASAPAPAPAPGSSGTQNNVTTGGRRAKSHRRT